VGSNVSLQLQELADNAYLEHSELRLLIRTCDIVDAVLSNDSLILYDNPDTYDHRKTFSDSDSHTEHTTV
jgi:hypothetical protein